MRIVTCVAIAALVLSASAAAGGERELLAPLSDGSIAFISAEGVPTGTVAGRPVPGGYAAVRPVWSPDGTRVAFSQGGIVVADLDGTLHRLTTSVTNGFDVEPTWSSDGREIAFRRNRGDGIEDLAVVSAGGGAVRRLTTDGLYDYQPSWQPGGRRSSSIATSRTAERTRSTSPAEGLGESPPVRRPCRPGRPTEARSRSAG